MEQLNWSKEYKNKGIPSSFRNKPSGSVEYFYRFLKKNGITKGKVLDLGCGKGRNSFFFAKKGFEVHAIDFVPEVVEEIKGKVKALCQSITDDLPYSDNYFDVVIDIFCYKHQTNKENQANHRKELKRVLKKEGYYLLTLAADDDEFYGQLLKNSRDPQNKLVVDPFTNVESYLYSKKDVEKEFSDFKIIDFQHKKKKGFMHDKIYMRSTMLFIMTI